MRHIFVVNPCAGGRDHTGEIQRQIDGLGIEAEVYVTRSAGDATRFVRERCQQSAEPLRFYACGGDGTLNEVADACVGNPMAEVACVPCGSGNDYIKCWPNLDFGNMEALAAGNTVEVDTIRVRYSDGTAAGNAASLAERVCVNVLNFGFEAEVCRTMQRVRRWPLLGGPMAYTTGILHCLLHSRHNPCRITVDGTPLAEGDLLLASAAVGQYVGGGYRCAPRAMVDDGLLEVMAIDSLGIIPFARMIGTYRDGSHLEDPQIRKVLHYSRGKQVVFHSDRPFSMVVDGELLRGSHFEALCLPHSLRFVLPKEK